MSAAPGVRPETDGLELRDLTVRLGADGPVLLERRTLALAPGSTLVVAGAAGSGKPTVLATLAGLRPPASGQVLLGRRPVSADRVGQGIGYAAQSPAVFGTLTAVENVALTLRAQGVPAAEAWPAAESSLQEVGLARAVHHNLAEQLSGGQRQRLAFARAAAGRPGLLVADDPTSELDAASAQRVICVLHRLIAEGTSVVLATTDPDVAALADLVLTLAGAAAPGS
jgi:ABC-type lipoprotein export system ATPase subunit